MGCDELQGYLFAKPMSARALLLWASDDRERVTAFKPSLFGQTRPMTPADSAGVAHQAASTVAMTTRLGGVQAQAAFAETLRSSKFGT